MFDVLVVPYLRTLIASGVKKLAPLSVKVTSTRAADLGFRCHFCSMLPEIEHSFIRISEQGMDLRSFDEFKLGRPDMTLKRLFDFCD